MGAEHSRARGEGTGERQRGTDGSVVPLAYRWQEWGSALLVLWDRTRREVSVAAPRTAQEACDAGLAAMMEAARPAWPAADRRRFVEVQLDAFRHLADDPAVRAELGRRAWDAAAEESAIAAFRALAAQVDDPQALAGPYAVIAGLVGRYGGSHRRAVYILDAVIAGADAPQEPVSAPPASEIVSDLGRGRAARALVRGGMRAARSLTTALRSGS